MAKVDQVKFVKDIYHIELVLMEAQKELFKKRLELQIEINDLQNKGANTLTKVALANSNLYKMPVVSSTSNGMPIKRTEIIDFGQTHPTRVPTERNKSRKNENNQQEVSLNESENVNSELANRELEEQNGEIEIDMDIHSQMKQSLKDEKNLKKKYKKTQANCPVCTKLLSSRDAVKRHIRVIHKMSKTGESQTTRLNKLILQQNDEIPV